GAGLTPFPYTALFRSRTAQLKRQSGFVRQPDARVKRSDSECPGTEIGLGDVRVRRYDSETSGHGLAARSLSEWWQPSRKGPNLGRGRADGRHRPRALPESPGRSTFQGSTYGAHSARRPSTAPATG